MSDNTQPASSRRALREKRRAEMEALLANSKAEQEAREEAAKNQQAQQDSSPRQNDPKEPASAAKAVSEPQESPKPAAASKPQQGAAPKTGSASDAAKSSVPSAAKPEPEVANKTATPDDSAPATKPAANKPASAATKSTPDTTANKPAATQSKGDAAKSAAAPVAAKTPANKTATGSGTASESESAEPVLGERASLRRARDREELRERRRLQEEVSQLTTNVPTAAPAEEPKPLTRRQLRLQALAEQQKTDGSAPAASKPATAKPVAEDDAPETTVMSVEEALAARRQHAPTPAVDPNLLRADDNEIDLEVLAHQREMAARAAIISRRAAERERIRQENVKAGKEVTSPDPFTGAMGSISELEDQVARSGVSAPKTSSVSLNLDASGKTPASTKPAAAGEKKAADKPAPKPAVKSGPKAEAKPAANAAQAPKQTANTEPESEAVTSDVIDLPRVEAVQAQGLQPLDAQTAGVRRANNMFLAMIAALAVGGIALVAGIIMMFSN